MRLYPLLLPSGLLSRAIGPSAAFQIRLGRPILPAILKKTSTPPPPPAHKAATKNAGLLSKITGFMVPRSGRFASKLAEEERDDVSRERILALVTTCCLALVARPSAARAANPFFIDPVTLTCEFPGLGSPPGGSTRIGDLIFADATCHKSLVYLSQALLGGASLAAALWLAASTLLVAGSLVRSVWNLARLVYDKLAPFDDGHPLGNLIATSVERARREGATAKDAGRSNEARHVGWEEYSRNLLGPPQRKKESRAGATTKQSTREDAALHQARRFSRDQKSKLHQPKFETLASDDNSVEEGNPQANQSAGEDAALHQANRFSQDQKSKPHQSKFETLASDNNSGEEEKPQSTWVEYKLHLRDALERQVEKSEVTAGRLQIMKNSIAWDDYKLLVNELQGRKSEVNELKQEVRRLQGLLQTKQSIHQIASNKRPPNASGDSTIPELELMNLLSRDYEAAVEESLSMIKDQSDVDWQQVEGDLGSGIK